MFYKMVNHLHKFIKRIPCKFPTCLWGLTLDDLTLKSYNVYIST